MKLFCLVGIICVCCAIASCGGKSAIRNTTPLAPCEIASINNLVQSNANGVKLGLPAKAKGPLYDSDDFYASRPTWTGERWRLHFVYGNGGLTEFMEGDRCCSLDDDEMRRRVCVGEYMYYGAMADISRVTSPDKISSAQVTIEPNGLSENEALNIIATIFTTWEQK